MSKHVLILGAGFGGLEVATRLSETIAEAVRVTLIDRNDSFYFGFSKLEVMLGRQSADDVRLHYRDFAKDGVEFRQETVTDVDPAARRVTTDLGYHDADFVVVALGADYDFAATPGFEQGGHEYYSLAGAERLRDALAKFDGGKVLVSVLGQPFKCPPAPFEGSFLLHEHFTQQGIRDSVEMTTTFPMARPVPVTSEVAQMFRDGLAARNVKELPEHLVTGIDPTTRTALLASGETLPYDLFVGIPIHRAPAALADTGLAVNNWVPVDQSNLRTRFPGVYALGDVCTGPRNVPKAGIFAEAAARVVAEDIAATIGAPSRPRRTRARASATPSSATGSSARSRSASYAATLLRPNATTPRSSTPPRRRSSARSAGHAGSGARERYGGPLYCLRARLGGRQGNDRRAVPETSTALAPLLEQSGCLACHMIGAVGNSGPGPDLSRVGAKLSKAGIEHAILDPGAPMPSFSNMPSRKFRALVRFLTLLR